MNVILALLGVIALPWVVHLLFAQSLVLTAVDDSHILFLEDVRLLGMHSLVECLVLVHYNVLGVPDSSFETFRVDEASIVSLWVRATHFHCSVNFLLYVGSRLSAEAGLSILVAILA